MEKLNSINLNAKTIPRKIQGAGFRIQGRHKQQVQGSGKIQGAGSK
jgi:hypothetical protein